MGRKVGKKMEGEEKVGRKLKGTAGGRKEGEGKRGKEGGVNSAARKMGNWDRRNVNKSW